MSALLCAVPLISTLLTACAAPGPLAVGYVEGEYVLVAPIEAAQIVSIDVRRGDRVEAGQPLAHLDTSDTDIAIAERQPYRRASYDAAATTPRWPSCPTSTGRPRSSGWSRCSTDA